MVVILKVDWEVCKTSATGATIIAIVARFLYGFNGCNFGFNEIFNFFDNENKKNIQILVNIIK